MLLILKGELVKKGVEPVKAIMETLNCTDKTARNKLNAVTNFTIPEALAIKEKYFKDDNYQIEWLFCKEKSTA